MIIVHPSGPLGTSRVIFYIALLKVLFRGNAVIQATSARGAQLIPRLMILIVQGISALEPGAIHLQGAAGVPAVRPAAEGFPSHLGVAPNHPVVTDDYE